MSETKKVDVYLDKVRELSGKEFRIDKIFKSYRKGFASDKKPHEFYQWPKDDRQVIESGDKKSIDNGASASFDYCREKIKNKETKKYEFHKYPITDRSNFFKTFKKVFDVRVTLKETSTFKKWDGTQVDGKYVMVKAVPASIIKSALEVIAKINVPMVPGKELDNNGKPKMFRPFDWEDGFLKELEGAFCGLAVTGVDKETRYIVYPTAKFVTPEDDFGKDFGKEEPKKEGITVADIPF